MIQNESQPLSKEQRQFIFFVIIGSALAIVIVASLLNRFLDQQFGPPDLDATVTAVSIRSTLVSVEATQAAIEATETALNASSISSSSLAPLPETATTWDGLHIEVIEVNHDAWPLIKAHNQFNDSPESNKRMMLVTLRVSNVEGPEEEFIRLSTSDFAFIGNQQILYKTFRDEVRCGVIPNRLDSTLERGMTMTETSAHRYQSTNLSFFWFMKHRTIQPSIFLSLSMVNRYRIYP